MIKLIVGLGNPGQQYEKTRHNAGFIFMDHMVSAFGGKWAANSQFNGDVANCSLVGHRLVLLKPMTFMNRSGASVGSVLRYYKFNPNEMLVVHDELELPEGVARLKKDGGHSGHNGLRDIITHVDTRDFYRLRLGIGRPSESGDVADYVLSQASRDACALMDDACQVMIKNIDMLLRGDVDAVNKMDVVRGLNKKF